MTRLPVDCREGVPGPQAHVGRSSLPPRNSHVVLPPPPSIWARALQGSDVHASAPIQSVPLLWAETRGWGDQPNKVTILGIARDLLSLDQDRTGSSFTGLGSRGIFFHWALQQIEGDLGRR